MKRKVLFVGALFLALGVTMLLSQQGQRALSQDRQCPAGRFPAFVPMPGVTPRGVAVDKVGYVYVSAGELRADGEHILIWKFTPSGRGPSPFAEIGQGTIGGLAVSADGDLYVAMAAGLDKGVWRVDRKGRKSSCRAAIRSSSRMASPSTIGAPCMSPNPYRCHRLLSDRAVSGASRAGDRRNCACEMGSSREPVRWASPSRSEPMASLTTMAIST